MVIHRSTNRKTILDTHYSYLNNYFKVYVEDDNDILIEDYIVKSISFNGGIYGTTAVLVDAANLFGKRASNKINFKIKTGSQETHEVCWRKYLVEVTKLSNASVTEIIQLTKLQMCENNGIFVNVVSRIKSVKPEIWMKEGGDEEPVVAPKYYISTKMRLI